MCGFAGVIGTEGAPPVEAMLEVLRHRGPDDEGIHRSNGAALGFRRLSIIDLAGGAQPMPNEDRSLWLVCNGEIYNDPDLRAELKSLGHVFRTSSDCESILHAYEAWGPSCVARFRGMFAFAIWDERRRTLFAARDRLGKKPFHYFVDSRRLVVASELKALLQVPGVRQTIDRTALRFYLRYQYIPAPHTIYEGIRKLEPGHWLRWTEGRLETGRYWTPDLTPLVRRPEEWCEELRAALVEAVRIRLRSDVPFGAYLSGGIDSSIVVGLMSRLLREPVRTFSIGFEEEEFSELPYARQVARLFGTQHHERIVRPEVEGLLDRLVWFYDEPFGDSSAVPTYHVANVSAPHVKVILSGDGGDESFGGYYHYGIFRHLLGLRVLPAVIPRTVRSLVPRRSRISTALDLASMPKGRLFSRLIERFHTDQLDDLMGSKEGRDLADPYVERAFDIMYRVNGDPIRSACYADLTTFLPSDILTKVDIASMANSQEVRCPLLDHKVVELALRIPGTLKLRGQTTKYILKRAFSDLVPPEILNRRKQGFSIPARRWLQKELRPMVEESLLGRNSSLQGWVNLDLVADLYRQLLAGVNHADKIWGLLFLERWLRLNGKTR